MLIEAADDKSKRLALLEDLQQSPLLAQELRGSFLKAAGHHDR